MMTNKTISLPNVSSHISESLSNDYHSRPTLKRSYPYDKYAFVQTNYSIDDILAKKRAKNNEKSEKLCKNGVEDSGKRLFGKDFLPTKYSPDRTVLQNKSSNNQLSLEYDLPIFLSTLLSIPVNNLMSIDEESISQYIQFHYSRIMFNSPEKWISPPLCYKTLDQFKDFYTPLIIYDAWAQIKESNYKANGTVLNLNYHNLEAKILDSEIYLVLRGHFSEEQTKNLQFENWFVLITPKGEAEKSFFGLVSEYKQVQREIVMPKLIGNHKIMFQFRFKLAYEPFINNKFYINNIKSYQVKLLYYLNPTLRLIKTISLMYTRTSIISSMLWPKLQNFVPIESQQKDTFVFVDQSRYNQMQRFAITSCINAVKFPFSQDKFVLIQGPPGTGKTHTLVGIVKNLFANAEDNDKPLRVMLCAPSNGAIDEIARRLIHERHFLVAHKKRSLRVVRIGQRAQVHANVQKYLLDSLIDRNMKQEPNTSLPRIRDQILFKADVLLSTLQSSQQSCLKIFDQTSSKLAIRCVIVDEASQCTEPELLMPLIYPSISKVILIGDHRQLPATVISQKAQQLNFGRSTFERFFQYFQQAHPERIPIITLNEQYRMVPEICQFPSRHFYEGRLMTSISGDNPLNCLLKPYHIFDIVDSKESSVSLSKLNDAEVEFVTKLAKIICQNLNIGQKRFSVGIVTFYRKQCEAINLRLHEQCLNSCISFDVNTVDAFQGQERDIIILSCVRALDTSHSRSIGFVQSQQRMNVALTRARSALIICLSGKSFLKVPGWNQLIRDAQIRNRYHILSSKTPNTVLYKKLTD